MITVGTCTVPDVASVSDFTISATWKKAAFPFTVSPPSVVQEPYARMSFDALVNFANGEELAFLTVSSAGPISI